MQLHQYPRYCKTKVMKSAMAKEYMKRAILAFLLVLMANAASSQTLIVYGVNGKVEDVTGGKSRLVKVRDVLEHSTMLKIPENSYIVLFDKDNKKSFTLWKQIKGGGQVLVRNCSDAATVTRDMKIAKQGANDNLVVCGTKNDYSDFAKAYQEEVDNMWNDFDNFTNSLWEDYEAFKHNYRVGHADRVYEQKYGIRDWRGGGRASARETAGRVVAGCIAKQSLRLKGVSIHASLVQVGAETDPNKFAETITAYQQDGGAHPRVPENPGRVQPVLQLLHYPLRPRPGAEPQAGGCGAGGGNPCLRGIPGDRPHRHPPVFLRAGFREEGIRGGEQPDGPAPEAGPGPGDRAAAAGIAGAPDCDGRVRGKAFGAQNHLPAFPPVAAERLRKDPAADEPSLYAGRIQGLLRKAAPRL